MNLSIIIPTLNEAENIGRLIRHLLENSTKATTEIIVVDAGSKDDTVAIAEAAGAAVYANGPKGRALQMNYGAQVAKGTILFFVHGDTLPVASFEQDIQEALAEGFSIGCYRYKFDSPKRLLKINAYFTRFNFLWCRGGDQTLFIRKSIFDALGRFNPEQVIMEDFEFLKRIKDRYPFRIIPKSIVVSARKYETNSYWRVQLANFLAFNMFRFGVSPQRIASMYKWMLGDARG